MQLQALQPQQTLEPGPHSYPPSYAPTLPSSPQGRCTALYCHVCTAGEGKMYRCLEDSRNQPGFSPACGQDLERFIQRQSADYTLNFGEAAAL